MTRTMDKTKDVFNEGTRSFRGIHISCVGKGKAGWWSPIAQI